MGETEKKAAEKRKTREREKAEGKRDGREKDSAQSCAIVLAAGRGTRMGTKVQKQFLDLGGYPVLYYSLKAFEESRVDEVILVTGQQDVEYCKKEIVEKYGFAKVSAVTAGGAQRYHSVYEGLKCVRETAKIVLIHDGARPFLDDGIIDRAIDAAARYGACAVGMPSKDTVKIADEDGFAASTPERSLVWTIQTPQAFSRELILSAYRAMMADEELQQGITDDAMVVERFTLNPVRLAEGSYENIKVTTPEDMEIAEAILKRRKRG